MPPNASSPDPQPDGGAVEELVALKATALREIFKRFRLGVETAESIEGAQPQVFLSIF